MKVLVFAHQLTIGGTQVNAIELSAALRDLHGCDVVFFATAGPMIRLVREKKLRYIPAPEPRANPSIARMAAFIDTVRHERPDVLHVWDWWQCLDAYYGAYMLTHIPMVVTDMMMNLTRILPKRLPTTFGTPELLERAKKAGRSRAVLMLPPVDTHLNAPNAVDGKPLREQYGIKHSEITLATVSRLVDSMKAESLIRTIEVVRILGRDLPLRFMIAGDGGARSGLQRLADQVNSELKRPAVLLLGEYLDPRPVYAAADIVVGMGGSSLRGMAFGKPVVVVGERGFSAPFSPDTANTFYYKGFYGLGNGTTDNRNLLEDIRRIAQHPDSASQIGEFSRQFVVKHFSLEVISAELMKLLRNASTDIPRKSDIMADGLRTAAVYLRERRFLYQPPTENTTVIQELATQ